ncbi:hypothetical protein J6590_006049 [Homalodisca vitripennis]|nr:hypothetical protein J6590_006049 [Homalodisca vitripennis]
MTTVQDLNTVADLHKTDDMELKDFCHYLRRSFGIRIPYSYILNTLRTGVADIFIRVSHVSSVKVTRGAR